MKKNISIFYITVDYLQIPHYFYRFEYLPKNDLNFLFGEDKSVLKNWLQVTSIAVIHYQIEMIICLYCLMQSYDVITCWQIT